MVDENTKIKLKDIYDNNNLAVFLCDINFVIIEVNDFITKNNISIKTGESAKIYSVENEQIFLLGMKKLKKGLPYSNYKFTFCMRKTSVFMIPVMNENNLERVVCCIDLEEDCFNVTDSKDVPVRVYQNLCGPLTSILDDLTPIARRLDLLEQYDELTHLNDAVKHCYRALQACESIVNYHKLVNNEVNFNFKTVSLNYYMEDLMTAVKLIVSREERKIILKETAQDIIISIDEKFFSIAIFNLILNSCLFSPKDSTITISIGKNNGFATISVIDEGDGIETRECQNAFLPFQSNIQEIVPYKRIGLGLPTVKKVMEKHSGRVMLDSNLNSGTCVALSFPIKKLKKGEEANIKTAIGSYLADKYSPLYTIFCEISKAYFY